MLTLSLHFVITMKEKKTFPQLDSKGGCQVYELLLKYNLVSFPLVQEGVNKIESLVAVITNTYFGTEIYEAPEEKALAYLYFLIKDHPFVDGNKRTACLTFAVVCEINKLIPDYSKYKLDEIAIFIEKTIESDHQNVIKLLSKIIFKNSDTI